MVQVAIQEEQQTYSKLFDNEHRLCIAKRHWISQIPVFLALTAGIAFILWIIQNSLQHSVSYSSLCLIAAICLSGIYCFLRLRSDHIILTEKRIVVHEGLLRPKSVSVAIQFIERVDVNSGGFESRFNAGGLTLRLVNGTKLCQTHIARPRTFRNKWAAQFA